MSGNNKKLYSGSLKTGSSSSGKGPTNNNDGKSSTSKAIKPANAAATSVVVKNGQNADALGGAQEKFLQVQKKHIQAAQKLIDNYESSSDEDFENDSLFDSVFKNYNDDKSKLQKTQQFLENVFQSAGAAICLICITTVKRIDSIWSCDSCYNFFHLNCIQRWATDTIYQKTRHQELAAQQPSAYYNTQGEYIVKAKTQINWDCPKCRTIYESIDIPRHYACFCKKEINPQNHPWMVPHSCGEMCGKNLQPTCGHKCVLLCHPGPCPPCPQMITTSCECEQSPIKAIRCSQKSWNCVMKCKSKLACGIHVCGLTCHSKDNCPVCTKKSLQKCLCGNTQMERNCCDSKWQCNKICNKQFSCGLHKCEKRCHVGDCGACPLGLPRACPCGKMKSQAPCSSEIECCGDTCQKLLSCGVHICAERCHKGDCSQCLEKIDKICRCGLHTKELPCSKEFTCSVKCKRMRDCQKHACNSKCCEGQCPPCLKICGKTLACGKHKCTSCCHSGQCYPCTLKVPVKCRCKGTAISVPCGREKSTKPPKCNLPCKIPSVCHHDNTHRCHANECPTCNKKCMLRNDTTNCEHPCMVKCHASVKVSIVDKSIKPATPFERQQEIIKIQKLPHPPCAHQMEVTCIGGHETAFYPCWNSKPSSCGRPCGRQLNCTNHKCNFQCHKVTDLKSNTEDKNCQSCQENCKLERPKGCCHQCVRECHPAPCNPCAIHLKSTCHCGLTQIYYKCNDLYKMNIQMDSDEFNQLKEKCFSCGNRCIKNYKCGHRCVALCHTGICPNPEQCKKKIKCYCECKNKKIEITCDKLRSGFTLNCDDSCTIKMEEQRKQLEALEQQQNEYEEERRRTELIEFEKKFGKKKYKERKQKIIQKDKPFDYKPWIIGISIIIGIISIVYLINMNI